MATTPILKQTTEQMRAEFDSWIEENKKVMNRGAFDNDTYGVDPDELVDFIKKLLIKHGS